MRRRSRTGGKAAPAVLGAAVVSVALAGCGGSAGEVQGVSSDVSSASPAASAPPAATPAGAAPTGVPLAFDDGSPGRLTAARAADGATTATLELDTSGAEIAKVTLSAANRAADVTGLEIPLTGSAGAWAGQVLLPLPGAWTFEVLVQRNDGGFRTEDLADVTVTL